jgi:hypothetical protein
MYSTRRRMGGRRGGKRMYSMREEGRDVVLSGGGSQC